VNRDGNRAFRGTQAVREPRQLVTKPLNMQSPEPISRPRNVQLDCLRGVAILLVISRHTILFRAPGWDAPVVQFGWAGVDLFFVLSGFLISGLLFSEFRQKGSIRFARFALRRALKIYPAFYVLVLLTILIRILYHRPEPILRPFLNDLFFLQSYYPGTYGHFWSLSVEEHFYIFLPVLMYLMIRLSAPRRRPDPFCYFPVVFLFIAALLLSFRLWTSSHIPFSWQTHLFPTHLRIDSLLFGVVLSYMAHFHAEKFWRLTRPRYPLLLLVGFFFISPGFLLTQETPWMYTYGSSLLYLGFGAILIGTLAAPIESAPQAVRFVFRWLGFIGGFSYSIYLWHIPLLIWLGSLGILRKPYLGSSAFVLGSLALGIITSKLIEIPVVRLRDRLFPQTVSATPTFASAGTIAFAHNAASADVSRTSDIGTRS
jgi:peptidoglycan/LPS O-acetylase OafA/YrhL